MIQSWRRVLVLAPHTDDGEFGCGGTTARLLEAGADVRYVAFSIATRSLPEGFPPDTLAREVREATTALGIPEANLTVHDLDVRTFPVHRQEILEALIEIWNEWQPDVVFARAGPHRAEGRRGREVRVSAPPPLRERRVHLEPRARPRHQREPRLRRGVPGLPDRRLTPCLAWL